MFKYEPFGEICPMFWGMHCCTGCTRQCRSSASEAVWGKVGKSGRSGTLRLMSGGADNA